MDDSGQTFSLEGRPHKKHWCPDINPVTFEWFIINLNWQLTWLSITILSTIWTCSRHWWHCIRSHQLHRSKTKSIQLASQSSHCRRTTTFLVGPYLSASSCSDSNKLYFIAKKEGTGRNIIEINYLILVQSEQGRKQYYFQKCLIQHLSNP